MKKPRLLCIPPYEGMYNLLTNIAAQRGDVELVIHMGNLEEGLRAVLENRDESIDAIISRGGTTEAIRPHVDIPVCDMAPTAYDLLRTMRLAQGMGEAFAVVGFSGITKQAGMLCDIMQYDTRVRTIHSAEECANTLRELRDEGVRIIVGDTISANLARDFNMHGLLIVSGMESVEAAIDSAKETLSYNAALRKRGGLLSAILGAEEDACVVFSPDGQLLFSTWRELPAELETALRERVSYVIAQDHVKLIRRWEEDTLTIRGRALRDGGEEACVYRVSRSARGSPLSRHMIRYLSAESDLPACNPLEYYVGGGEPLPDLQALCARYAKMSAPVLIEGAYGTGKDRFAHYIYTQSPLRHSSFVIIDAELLDEKGWGFLLGSDLSPLTDTGLSLYFRMVNAASPEAQRELWLYLKNSGADRSNRLTFSYTTEPGHPVQPELYLYLTESLHCLRLTLPALTQRREDIPTLVSLYINALNVRCGTRVIGLTREAMLTMQNSDWPHNVDQLVQAVQELVIGAKSSYISEEQVRAVLARSPVPAEPAPAGEIDLNRSMEEIVRDIVQRVYRMEDMNQTRTAKHLDISRSTLWRMLK